MRPTQILHIQGPFTHSFQKYNNENVSEEECRRCISGYVQENKLSQKSQKLGTKRQGKRETAKKRSVAILKPCYKSFHTWSSLHVNLGRPVIALTCRAQCKWHCATSLLGQVAFILFAETLALGSRRHYWLPWGHQAVRESKLMRVPTEASGSHPAQARDMWVKELSRIPAPWCHPQPSEVSQMRH